MVSRGRGSSFVIRDARPEDSVAIVRLVRALAEYEKLLQHVEIEADQLREAFFSKQPRAFCSIAEVAGKAVGYAIWFYNFSTFTGRHGIFLEDLFVEPEHRGLGIGKAFLRHLARRCVAENLSRLDWAVLDWNEPSIAFYRVLGAIPLDSWTGYRLSGDALARLGSTKA